jgi:ketosteroid isomerase-like protein
MEERDRIIEAAQQLADAISRKDTSAIAGILAPEFVYRTPGGSAVDAAGFMTAIGEMPGEIVFVRLHGIEVDLWHDGAVVTGVQHARVRVDGKEVDDERPFLDWFVKHADHWRIRLAADLTGKIST